MRAALPSAARRPAGAAACALVLAACCGLPPRAVLEARELARSPYCNTPGAAAQVLLLPDARAVRDWQAARGVALVPMESVAPAPHAVVEMGQRPTGGYGVSVSPQATQDGERVVLRAAFTAPPPDSLRTQALSSPCALVQLPEGRWAGVEVRDAAGALLARGGAVPDR